MTETRDKALREQIDRQFLVERGLESPWPGFEKQVLFELKLDVSLVTLTMAESGLPAGHTIWRA
jgi:hypothetical protein